MKSMAASKDSLSLLVIGISNLVYNIFQISKSNQNFFKGVVLEMIFYILSNLAMKVSFKHWGPISRQAKVFQYDESSENNFVIQALNINYNKAIVNIYRKYGIWGIYSGKII